MQFIQRLAAFSSLIVIAICNVTAQNPANRKTELDGSWSIVVVKLDGQEFSKEEMDTNLVRQIRFKDGVLTSFGKDGKIVSEGPFKIDPQQNPPTIDMLGKNLADPKKDFFVPGIYRIQGTSLTICTLGGPVDLKAPVPKLTRPKNFNGGPGSSSKIMIFRKD